MIAGARLASPPFACDNAKSPLLFVHGVGSTAAIWDYQLEALGSDRLCAAIELRGNGASKPDPEPSTITRAGFVQDVLAVADAIGGRRFTLVGCSLGGVVAFELWQSAPERIERLVLVSTFARYPEGESYARKIAEQVREAGSMRVFGERRAALLGLPSARLRETIEQMACKSVECYLAATLATWTGDHRYLLPTISVPVLVIYGERDAVVPRALAEEIAGGIPGAELAMIPQAGHVTNADNPAAFNQLLRDFLA